MTLGSMLLKIAQGLLATILLMGAPWLDSVPTGTALPQHAAMIEK